MPEENIVAPTMYITENAQTTVLYWKGSCEVGMTFIAPIDQWNKHKKVTGTW